MEDLNKLCLGCMREKPDFSPECPYCHYDAGQDNESPALPVKTVLQNRYIVGKVITSNGEGITYIGYDTTQNIAVRIREYFPQGLCERINLTVKSFSDSQAVFDKELDQFLELARALARMRSLSALLPVYDIFEANSTAYYISESVDSITLRDFLIRNGGSLTFSQMRPLFMPIMSTLSSLHAVDIIHRGISPDTLIIGKDGRIRLTEFCIADARTARSEIPAQLFKGYAAIEQYGFEGEQGPWTDVYAIAAVIYRTLVGSPPPEATARVTNDKLMISSAVADHLSKYAINGLMNALKILPAERTQSIDVFRDELSAAPSVVAADEETFGQQEPQDQKRGKKGKVLGIIAAVLAVAVLGSSIYFVINPGSFSRFTTALGNGISSMVGGIFSAFGGNADDVQQTQLTTTTTQTTGTTQNFFADEMVTVPDFVEEGAMYADIKAQLDDTLESNYVLEISDKEYNDAPAGTIIKQTPEAGTQIKAGETITVVLSLGPKNFAMPNLIGLTREEAIVELFKAGFSYENIEFGERVSPNAKAGTVVYVEPQAGETVNADIKIVVDIAKATTTQTTIVTQTDVVGSSEATQEPSQEAEN